MKSEKKIFLFITLFIVVCTAVMVCFPKEEKMNKKAIIRVGAGDDISGTLMNEIIDELPEEYSISSNIEGTFFKDC